MGKVLIRQLGLREYQEVYESMARYTSGRDAATMDEVWCLEHEQVFTLGLGGRPEHVLDAGGVPVRRADRGGQVTYHGPGQLVVYPLLDLRRLGISVKRFVNLLEEAVIRFLATLNLAARRRPGAPGVYLAAAKVASLGIRVRKGCCYHGVALNVTVDLAPFQRINPCGFPALKVTRLADWGVDLSAREAAAGFLPCLLEQLACRAEAAPAAGLPELPA